MASRSVPNNACFKLPKNYKEVSSLTKPKLKEVCRTLSIDFEKSIGKKALVNVVCNALKISTSGSCSISTKDDSSSSTVGIPPLAYLQRLKEWQKNLNGVPLMIEEATVKEFLIGAGYKEQAVRKYKTLRAWEHKQGIHSVRYVLISTIFIPNALK